MLAWQQQVYNGTKWDVDGQVLSSTPGVCLYLGKTTSNDHEFILYSIYIHVNMGVSINTDTQNRWFVIENPINMDDLGVLLF